MVMNKEELKLAVDESLSYRDMAKRFGCSPTNIRYWLKKYGILQNIRKRGDTKKCSLCHVTKPVNEFFKREKQLLTSRCKKCTVQEQTKRSRNNKLNMITYKGGACSRCNYNRCFAAFDFHHRDPKQKDFRLSKLKGSALSISIMNELDKCDLLCAVCHREVHYEWIVKKRQSKPSTNLLHPDETKHCTKCNIDMPKSMFYKFSGSVDGLSWECKHCNYQRKTDHQDKIKLSLIASVGLKPQCDKCGYSKRLIGLDIHHMDPNLKDIKMSDIQSIKLDKKQIDEMKNCKVLCANCHRETHYAIETGDPGGIRIPNPLLRTE